MMSQCMSGVHEAPFRRIEHIALALGMSCDDKEHGFVIVAECTTPRKRSPFRSTSRRIQWHCRFTNTR